MAILHRTHRKLWAQRARWGHLVAGFDVRFSAKEIKNWTRGKNHCTIDWTKGRGLKPHGPSLDRIDASGVMTLDNVQMTHFRCNASKGTRSMDELIEWCEKVVKWHQRSRT